MGISLEGRAGSCGIEDAWKDQPTIDELWQQYHERRTDWIKTRLIVHYMDSHVRRLAERLHSTLPQQVDIDDLLQQGYMGLAESIDRFDITREVRFETFSARRILGSMRDYLRSIDPIPRLARTRAKRLQALREEHQKEHGRPPSDHELRAELQVSVQKYLRLTTADRPAATVSYASQSDLDPDEDPSAMESLADARRVTPLTNAERKDLRRLVTRGFCQRDHLIIVLYYYEHLTMREVGSALGISESRVSQRLESILACLRARLYGEAESEFWI